LTTVLIGTRGLIWQCGPILSAVSYTVYSIPNRSVLA
jgi:hypothetical protein